MPVPKSRNPKTVKMRQKYARDRLQLIEEMGGECVKCREADPKLLELHHTAPWTWVASEVSRWVRIRKYRADWEAGELELYCRGCNASAGKPDDPEDDSY